MNTSELSLFFKCLSDPVRLRILNLLFHQSVICVCDITTTLGLPQSVVSRHLAYLRKHSLVVAERRGNWQHYSLASAKEQADSIIGNLELSAQETLFSALKETLKAQSDSQVDIDNMTTENSCC